MSDLYKAYYTSEIGLIELAATETALKSLIFVDPATVTEPVVGSLPPVLQMSMAQLDEYFKGRRKEFDLPLEPDGTDFQQRVWRQLLTVPFGKTVSYLDIAKGIGNLKAIRAVGTANGRNPISVIIPCHRIIGHDGSLVGYGGGLWRKEWLLNHEGCRPQMSLFE
jgi:methylated-DNA-[protein]-cysteine S-methyltransferase